MLRFLSRLLLLGVLLALIAAAGVGYGLWQYGRGLPDYKQLADYEPPTVTRVHAGDGRLLGEFAVEKRVFVPIDAIPRRVINAFISAEDQNFYSHPGVDVISVLRAAVTNLKNLGANRRLVGASTITQQVAKNFLLTNEVSLERKIKEAILAFRIEQAYSKDRILELYLNEIYLGFGSYGVAAAALNYFDKSLDELTIGEAAYLAALPKAPNNYHPVRRYEAAVARRNWVIGRMREDGRISDAQARVAIDEPLRVRERGEAETASADYFTEEVRRDLVGLFGEDKLYGGGLSVLTTVDARLQAMADAALRRGLIEYDRRHGWRGALERIEVADGAWAERLASREPPPGAGAWRLAVVLDLDAEAAAIGLADGTRGRIPMAELTWARPALKKGAVGAEPHRPDDVLDVGEVVLVEALPEAEGRADFALRQIPDVNGAIVALDPHTGRVLAMSGGFAFAESQFNRVTQADRQPGSAFKPFVYLTGLEQGYTPASIILDAPFVLDQGPGLGKWKPENYEERFYGPTPMRIGIEHSRNLMTIRLAQSVGIERVVATARRFGVMDDPTPQLSLAIGAGETTLMRLTAAYAMLVNGGKRITPSLIDRVQDRRGRTIYRHDERACAGCRAARWDGAPPPRLPDERERLTDPASAYQIVSMLQGVIERGTGRRAAEIGKPLAGKTGTTNDNMDAWFVGFSPDLAVGVFVGFDEPRTLGRRETGSRAALPIWKDFMAAALEDAPATPFRIPSEIRLVRIVRETGRLAGAGDSGVIWEAFKPGSAPSGEARATDGGAVSASPAAGGLY